MFLQLKSTDIGYEIPLIKGINAGLQQGEVCLLIGNNGVGKTTLIHSILHQIPTVRGEILINHKGIKKLSAKEIAEQVTVVFSKSQVPANFSVTDLVSLGKYIHYPYYFQLNDSDNKEVEEIIESLNLSQYKELSLTKLSDGNLQKAFIGRALAQNSPFIILDEPTTHLDEENKIMILKLLWTLAKKHHKIILFSSHDWRLAKEFADKIWYVKDQKLYAGLTEDILASHADLTDPQIFRFEEGFVAPKISAPKLQKELLYSVLQKNFKKDLSLLGFEFCDSFWEVSGGGVQQKAYSFTEIIDIIRNLH